MQKIKSGISPDWFSFEKLIGSQFKNMNKIVYEQDDKETKFQQALLFTILSLVAAYLSQVPLLLALIIAFIQAIVIINRPSQKIMEINENEQTLLIYYYQYIPPKKVTINLLDVKKLIIAANTIYLFIHKDGATTELKPLYQPKDETVILRFLQDNTNRYFEIETKNTISLFEEVHGIYYD